MKKPGPGFVTLCAFHLLQRPFSRVGSSRSIIFSTVLCCGFALTVSGQTQTPSSAPAPEAVRQTNRYTNFSAFAVPDEKGGSLPLFSPEAYRAEFHCLRDEFHKTDLASPAVKTDGWTYNIPQAEWPFMGFAYFGYASANFAKYDPAIRAEALQEMRWLIDALQTT